MKINTNLVPENYHLLVVDDDRRLRDLLTKFLKDQNFRVNCAGNAAEARSYLAATPVDLIVLDIMMPGENGLDFSKSLRRSDCFIPIIMLTAKDQTLDRIAGLDQGADDYITKPFEPLELLSRIKAILRRTDSVASLKESTLTFGGFSFNPDDGLLRKDGDLVHLTSTELILLKTLAQTPRQAMSREELAQRIGHRVSERTVDVQITRLRRKIGDDSRQPRFLQTVRHIGYALYPD